MKSVFQDRRIAGREIERERDGKGKLMKEKKRDKRKITKNLLQILFSL